MLSCIAAIGPNNEIGYKNDLIYKSKEDMKIFQKYTNHKTVLMGYKTWKSLRTPVLKNRDCIVIVKDNKPLPTDLSKALENYPQLRILSEGFLLSSINLYSSSRKEYIIMGGQRLYELTAPYWSIIYLTQFFKKPKNADTYFPTISKSDYSVTGYFGSKDFDFNILSKVR